MTDILSPAERSRLMARIGPKETRPEREVQQVLDELGIRYRRHVRELPGTPDFVLDDLHVAVFVHGCFWHRHPGCRFAYEPSTRPEFWKRKFVSNVRRDRRVTRALRRNGWSVWIIWECTTRHRQRLRTSLHRRLKRHRLL